MAVRSAYNVMKKARDTSWDDRRKAQVEAVEKFLRANPKARANIKRAEAAIARCDAQRTEAREVIAGYGLGRDYGHGQYGIENSDKFTKAGGRFDFKDVQKWSFDQVMAELAAAKEKDAAAILKRFGIIWE